MTDVPTAAQCDGRVSRRNELRGIGMTPFDAAAQCGRRVLRWNVRDRAG